MCENTIREVEGSMGVDVGECVSGDMTCNCCPVTATTVEEGTDDVGDSDWDPICDSVDNDCGPTTDQEQFVVEWQLPPLPAGDEPLFPGVRFGDPADEPLDCNGPGAGEDASTSFCECCESDPCILAR